MSDESNVSSIKLEKVLDRIRKLLALARGGASPEEAATAVSMAQKLMDEFHVSEAQVHEKDPSIPAESVEKAPLDEAAKTEFWKDWERTLAGVVARSFHCEAITYSLPTSRTAWLVGTLSDRQTVAYLFRYLQAELTRLGDVGYDMQGARDVEDVFDMDAPKPIVDRTPKAQWLQDFYIGAISTLDTRLTAERKTLAAAPQYGLMIAAREQTLRAFMKDKTKVGKLRKGRAMRFGQSRTGTDAGRAAGHMVQLGNPNAKRLT